MLSKNSKMTLKWVFKQRDWHELREWAKFIGTGGGCDDEGSGLFRKKSEGAKTSSSKKEEGARTFFTEEKSEGARSFSMKKKEGTGTFLLKKKIDQKMKF